MNALLEGDVAMVGMIGMGRAPDLRKARKRTIEPRIELSEGRALATVAEFLDVTSGLDVASGARGRGALFEREAPRRLLSRKRLRPMTSRTRAWSPLPRNSSDCR